MAFTYVSDAVSSVGFSGTETSVTIPVEVSEGDLLLLGVMARSAITTPDGWTLLETSSTEPDASQRQALFYKVAESGDSGDTLTVAQESAARIEIQVIAYSYEGTVSVEDSGSGVDTGGTGSITLGPPGDLVTATTSAADGNGVGAWAEFKDSLDDSLLYWTTVSFVLASSAGTTEITFSSPWVRTGGGAVSQRRLGSASSLPIEGNPRINQAPALVLVGVPGSPKVQQVATLVLWGTGSTSILNQSSVQVLSSFPRRRVVTITD